MLRYLCGWIALCVCFAFNAFADELTLQEGMNGYGGTADTSIYEDRPANANGGFAYIFSGRTGSSMRRALIRFDLAPLPPGAVIQSAELTLVMNQSGPNAADDDLFSLHRLTQAWGEGEADSGEPGGLGAPAGDGDATWQSRFHNQTAWQTPGGDFVAAPSASTQAAAGPGETVRFSSEPLAQDLQAWLDGSAENHGWILIGPETSEASRTARRFVSAEGSPPESRPALRIIFEAPTRVENWFLMP